jgi:metal-dependent amidase/aminoacylase/carboxypeptidase family protein
MPAASPHLGRSALDAVELMNVGVNYMREHMPSDARVHYALLDTGGIAPNVVQAHARVRYSIRARDLPGMNELVARVHKIAQGRALMTETSMEMRIISAVSNVMPNPPLEQAAAPDHGGSRTAELRRGGRAIRAKDPLHPDRQGYRIRVLHDRHGSDRPAAGRFHRAARRQAQAA